MKNFHVPLHDQTYESLQLEAQRSQLPATSVARQAIQAWLAARKRAERKRAIAEYAAEMAGTEMDLDTSLEDATLEILREGTWK
jgi:hypothetical protein